MGNNIGEHVEPGQGGVARTEQVEGYPMAVSNWTAGSVLLFAAAVLTAWQVSVVEAHVIRSSKMIHSFACGALYCVLRWG